VTIQAGTTRRRRRAAGSSDLERIEQALGDLVRLTSSARVHDARVRGSGVAISRTNLRFLDAVEELGPVSVSKLASRMDLSQPTASRALQQLESDGYVERASDPADGRVAVYSVTAGGTEAHQRMRTFMAGQLAEALRELPSERRHDMAESLTELVARLSVQQPGQPQPPARNDEGNA
jgi:DNA-binding MarR family transcriptional regulator